MAGQKILVIDDVPETRALLRAILTKQGYLIEEAGSGAEALSKVSSVPNLDLILLDVGLDDMSGFDFLSKIATLKRSMGLKVIFVTGKRSRPDIVKAIQLGGDDYVVKPIDPIVLTNKIKNLLQKDMVKVSVEIPTNYPAKLVNSAFDIPMRVLALSEEGLLLESPLTMAADSCLEITIPQLENIVGAGQVYTCKVLAASKHGTMFRAKVTFVGISEATAKALRTLTMKGKDLAASQMTVTLLLEVN